MRETMKKPTDQQLIDTLVIFLNTKFSFSLQIPDNLIEKCTTMCQDKKRSFKLTSPKIEKSGKTLEVEGV